MTALWLRTTLWKQLLGHPRAMPGAWGRFALHRILPRKEFMGRRSRLARGESLSKAGSSNCLFVGAITISVRGITAPRRTPPAAQRKCDPINHAAVPVRKPTAANGACMIVALL